jgi:HEAT repeat protein
MQRLIGAALLLVAASAYGAPLVSGPISVADDGTVSRAGARLGKLPLPSPPRRLEQRSLSVAGRSLLHVIVHGKGGRAAELVAEGGADEPVYAGATGPQGQDGEWSRHLRVDGSGVLLYERRDGAVRCDGAPIFLFPRLYDFAQRRFRAVSPVVRAEGLAELTAARRADAAPPGAPLNAFSLRFASTHAGDEGSAEHLGAPREAEDDDPATAWSEGMGGAGAGEFLSAQSPSSPYRLRALRIIPGDAASPRAFREANRLRSVLLLLGPKQGYRIRFARDPQKDAGAATEPYWAILPAPVATTCATLVIEEVYPGTSAKGASGGRTAISEARFFTELEFQGGLAQLARDLDGKDDARGKAAVTILVRLGKDALPIAGKDTTAAPAHALRRRLAVLLALRIPEAASPLASLVPRLGREPRALAIEGLVGLAAAAIDPVVALLAPGTSLDDPARADLLRALGQIGGERARALLLERAGAGSNELRAATVEGIGSLRGSDDLAAVIEAAAAARPKPRRQADLVHALGRLGRVERSAVVRRLGELYPGTTDFEVRYRILSSIGRLDADAGLPALVRAASDPDPILRWQAAEQLRRARGPGAIAPLRRALDDAHPPVRASAAVALLSRPRGDGEVGRSLARRLDRERWTFVLAATAEALGSHCVPEGIVALRRAVASGNAGVDLRALQSFARCAPKGLGAELVALARGRARTPIRVRALTLLGMADARAQLDALIPLLGELRDGAARSEADEVVAVAALRAVAIAGGTRAADALADALALDPHETIRTAAAIGLGRLCASAETLRRAAARDSASGVRRAASDALRRCKLR